jgi:hypothetical protein
MLALTVPSGRARTLPDNPQAEFVAHRFGNPEHRRPVRIADDLRHAFAVAQVNEDHAAVIAAPMRPATEADFLADEAVHRLVHNNEFACCLSV